MSDELGPDDEVDVIDADVVDGDADPAQLIASLEARCKAAKIPLESDEPGEDGPDLLITVRMPSGREHIPITLYDLDMVRAFLAVPFERYVLLSDYSAICWYQEQVIEANITSLGSTATSPSLVMAIQNLAGLPIEQRGARKPLPSLVIPNTSGEGRITIGPSSPDLRALGSIFARSRPSIRIDGIQIHGHDDATALLEKLANSILFQLDLTRAVPAVLARRRRGARRPFAQRSLRNVSLEFPRSEYDREPISLYWYARSASNMPLLQFLAYYQTIEYYFGTYSQAEARRKVRNVLKNPIFRPDRDADITKILAAAKANGSGYGDERSQLRATLAECIEPSALRQWFNEVPERAEFFSKKVEGLTEHRISIRNPTADLREEVAERIYDIRCKIVHTKATGRDGEVDLLLPFSKEAELLYNDIDLMQFCAREVLVSASTSMAF